jgi:peptide/nickel transport system permease protein
VAAYFVRRLVSALILVFALTFVTFVIFTIIPTQPGCQVVNCQPPRPSPPEVVAAAEHKLGVDRPIVVQYGDFVWTLLRHGTLGNAYRGFSVDKTLGQAIPATASIILGGAVVLLLLAIPLAFLSARRPRSLLDRGILLFALFGIALHPFVVGITLRNVFGRRLGIAPDAGYCALTHAESCSGPAQWAYHLWLPWLTFAFFFLPLYTRMIRSRVLDTYGEQYVIAARAKGASEYRVMRKHVLRNAIPPVLSMLATDIGTALTAAIYIETVFGLNGLGNLAVGALNGETGGYDLPVIVGVIFTVAVTVALFSMLADLAVAWLDPRVRLASGSGLVALPQPVERAAEATKKRVWRPAPALMVGLSAGVGVALLVAWTGDNTPAQVTKGPFTPIRTIPLNWTEKRDLNGFNLTFKVDSVSLGVGQWLVKASVTNRSKEPVVIQTEPGGSDFRSGNGFGLVHPQDDDSLFSTGLKELPATGFQPRPPERLEPGETWTGEFWGEGTLPAEKGVWVSFGRFDSVDGGRPFSYLTDEAIRV